MGCKEKFYLENLCLNVQDLLGGNLGLYGIRRYTFLQYVANVVAFAK